MIKYTLSYIYTLSLLLIYWLLCIKWLKSFIVWFWLWSMWLNWVNWIQLIGNQWMLFFDLLFLARSTDSMLMFLFRTSFPPAQSTVTKFTTWVLCTLWPLVWGDVPPLPKLLTRQNFLPSSAKVMMLWFCFFRFRLKYLISFYIRVSDSTHTPPSSSMAQFTPQSCRPAKHFQSPGMSPIMGSERSFASSTHYSRGKRLFYEILLEASSNSGEKVMT